MFNRIAVLLVFSFLAISQYAQENYLDTPININSGRYLQKELLKKIGSKYNIPFSYNDDILFKDKIPVYIGFDGTLEEFMYDYFVRLGYDYELVANQVIVFSDINRDDYVTVSGYIKEENSSEVLIGATVFSEDFKIGTVTNSYGYFNINLPKGQHKLQIKCIGYKGRSTNIFVWEEQRNDFYLEPVSYSVEEIKVIARKEDPFLESDILHTSKMNVRELQQMPGLFGEKDAINNISLLPGIQSNEMSTGSIFVRGGSTDQTTFLMDEANLYSASHFGGFFSVFNPDVVKNVSVYKSDIPVSEGGALSSLIDVRLRDGHQEQWKLKGSVGLISARALVEGPIKKNKSSLLFAYRQSYLGHLYPYVLSDSLTRKIRFHFYDMNFKYNNILNSKNRIYLSGYGSYDYFQQFNKIRRYNYLGSFRWNHIFSNRLFSNTSLIFSENLTSQDIFYSRNSLVWQSDNTNVRLKVDFSLLESKRARSEFGLSSMYYHILPNTYIDEAVDLYDVEWKIEQELLNSAYFIQHFLPTKNFSINAGLRGTYFVSQPEAADKEFYSDWFIEPHLHLSYKFKDEWLIKSSFSRPVQPIHQLPLSTMAININRWMPASEEFKPQVSYNYSLGVSKDIRDNFHASIELYYRYMDNLIETFQDMRILTVDNPSEYLYSSKGEAIGSELFVSYKYSKIKVYLSLDLSRVMWQTDGMNNNNPYLASHVRQNNFNLVFNYEITPRLSVSTMWKYGSGLPYTAATGRYEVDGREYFAFDKGQINTKKMPAYHTLNLSVDYESKHNDTRRWKSYWNMSLNNIYFRKNPLGVYYYTPTIGHDGNILDAEISPSYFYLYQFVPSVSYRFEF